MKIKSEKGFTGIDIAIAIVLVFIFVALIATLSYRISSTSKELDLKVDATYHAVDEIEKVKTWDFTKLIGVYATGEHPTQNTTTSNLMINDETTPVNTDGPGEEIKDSENNGTGFYKKITIKDYHDIDITKTEDVVKKVTVVISYQFKGKTEEVKLSILLAREK